MTSKPTDTDRDALKRAVEIARRDPSERQRIDAKLVRGGSWESVASSCAFSLQYKNLELQPWESPPMYGDIDQPRVDQHAAALLKRLLDAGLSRYEPDPIAALERAEVERAKNQPAK